MTLIIIRTEEAVKQYTLRQGEGDLTQSIDREVELKNWPHPADAAAVIDVKEYEDQTIQIYTDGNKNEQGFGSGVAIITGKELVTQPTYKLDNRCSKALEAIETIDIE
jgi:hypothetical protein